MCILLQPTLLCDIRVQAKAEVLRAHCSAKYRRHCSSVLSDEHRNNQSLLHNKSRGDAHRNISSFHAFEALLQEEKESKRQRAERAGNRRPQDNVQNEKYQDLITFFPTRFYIFQ